jgi:hypothetical protein
MQSKILSNKPLLTKDENIFIDLTTQSIRYNTEGKAVDAFLVGKEMTMRADLISKVAFGTDDEFDIILKYNGISNPFSIEENQLIFVPDLSFMYDSLVNPQLESSTSSIRNQYIDSSKNSKIDPKKIEYDLMVKRLQKSAPSGVKISSFGLPPNISDPGSREGSVTVNGNVIFGGDVTKSTKNG